MAWDLFTSLSLVVSVIIMWFQRRTIFELERDIWEIEKAYKKVTGKPYNYLHRQFQLWGNNEGNKEGEN